MIGVCNIAFNFAQIQNVNNYNVGKQVGKQLFDIHMQTFECEPFTGNARVKRTHNGTGLIKLYVKFKTNFYIFRKILCSCSKIVLYFMFT